MSRRKGVDGMRRTGVSGMSQVGLLGCGILLWFGLSGYGSDMGF